MSVIQPWLWLEEMHIKMIADSLGGSVWVADDELHWRPEGENKHIVVPYLHQIEPFDPDVFAAHAREHWAKAGAVM